MGDGEEQLDHTTVTRIEFIYHDETLKDENKPFDYDDPNPADVDVVFYLLDGTVYTVPAKDIKASSFKVPFLVTKGYAIFTTSDGIEINIIVTTYSSEDIYKEKLKIDQYARINAYEPGTFRSPFLYKMSANDYLPLFIAVPLCLFMSLAGLGICFIGIVGMVLGIPLIAGGIAVTVVVIRSTKNTIYGHCPICDKKFESSRSTPSFHCRKCKEQIWTRKDYFEV